MFWPYLTQADPFLYFCHHWNQLVKIWLTVALAVERYISVRVRRGFPGTGGWEIQLHPEKRDIQLHPGKNKENLVTSGGKKGNPVTSGERKGKSSNTRGEKRQTPINLGKERPGG